MLSAAVKVVRPWLAAWLPPPLQIAGPTFEDGMVLRVVQALPASHAMAHCPPALLKHLTVERARGSSISPSHEEKPLA
jgi:hypothetical protein